MFYVSIICVLLAIACALLFFRLRKSAREPKPYFAITKSVSVDGAGPAVPNNKTLKRLKSNVGYAIVSAMKNEIKTEYDGSKTTYSITLLIYTNDED